VIVAPPVWSARPTDPVLPSTEPAPDCDGALEQPYPTAHAVAVKIVSIDALVILRDTVTSSVRRRAQPQAAERSNGRSYSRPRGGFANSVELRASMSVARR
jgi:hypothetical protein